VKIAITPPKIIHVIIVKLRAMLINKLDIPYKNLYSFPGELSEIARNYTNSISKQLDINFTKAMNNDAFGNHIAFCYYKKMHMINALFLIIKFIYDEKVNQVKLYNEDKINYVYGDLYYRDKYCIDNLIKPYMCIDIDIKKTFNDVNFDGSVYITGIGHMYISPSSKEPIFTIFN